MNQFKTFFKELFTEAESFQAKSKETGKLVNFKSKASMDAALKAGSHENPSAPKGGKAGDTDSKKDVPKVNIFDKPKADTSTAPAIKHTKVGPDSAEVQTIAKYAGVREKFLADFINQHKLDAAAVANFVEKGSKEDRKDFFTAAVGNPGNEYEKKIIDKFGEKGDSKEEPTSKPKQQRKGNPTVNKEAKKKAEEFGITPQKLGKDGYQKAMYQAAVEALTDSNYHDEARELVASIEGKPEWAKKVDYPSMDDSQYDEKMKVIRTTGVDSSEYWGSEGEAHEFGRKVSQASGWGGVEAADGIAFTLRMNGFHKEADMIQSVFDDKPYMRESGPIKLGNLMKEAFNVRDLPTWLFDDVDDFEYWYEHGMALGSGKGKLAPFNSSDDKKLEALVKKWKDAEDDYQHGRGDLGTGRTTGARAASYAAQDAIKQLFKQKAKK
jgi:hypothetical protein